MLMLTHTVTADPGVHWVKDEAPAIEAPPDEDTDPPPDAQWPSEARRTGVCGAVTPKVVARREGGFRMYYTQILPREGHPAGANDYDQSTTRILSAISEDGFSWRPEPGVRLTPQVGGAGNFRVVSPDVVPVRDGEGLLRMYYECCPGPAGTTRATIRSALSADDGLTWGTEAGDRLGGQDSYCSPCVLHLDDGTSRMYCAVRGLGIVSALSMDGGLTFGREPGVRLAPGTEHDALTAFSPVVLRIAGGGYRIYYAGYGSSGRAHVLTARSTDGLCWARESRPAISPGARWDQAKCSELCVVELPGEPPRFRLFYEACDGTARDARGVWRILGATSA